MTDRFDQLAPRDVIITLRSLRRRFDVVATAAGHPNLGALIDAPGADQPSLAEILTKTAQAVAVIANETERALDHDQPLVAAAAIDRDALVFTDDRTWPLARAVESVADDAERIAERMEAATAGEQARKVDVVGGGDSTPLALAQELSRTAINALRAAEDQLDWMRSQA